MARVEIMFSRKRNSFGTPRMTTWRSTFLLKKCLRSRTFSVTQVNCSLPQEVFASCSFSFSQWQCLRMCFTCGFLSWLPSCTPGTEFQFEQGHSCSQAFRGRYLFCSGTFSFVNLPGTTSDRPYFVSGDFFPEFGRFLDLWFSVCWWYRCGSWHFQDTKSNTYKKQQLNPLQQKTCGDNRKNISSGRIEKIYPLWGQ